MRLPAAFVAAALFACAAPAHAHPRPAVPGPSGPYSVDVVDEAGTVLPTYSHRGRTYVLGTKGTRYVVRVRNDTAQRAEIVVSVDGRDVLDGRPASLAKRGYVVDAVRRGVHRRVPPRHVVGGGVPVLERAESYAAKTGDARDVGVIGVAVFPQLERRPTPPPPYAEPYSGAPSAGSLGGALVHLHARPAPPAKPTPRRPRVAPRAMPARAGARGADRVRRGAHVGGARHLVRPGERSDPPRCVTVRYDDRAGLVALGIDVDGRRWADDDARLREEAQAFRGSGFSEPPPGWRGR